MTNELSQSIFTCTNLSKSWLDKNGFKYNKSLSSKEDGEIYTMRFPVLSWNLYITVEAEIMVNFTDNLIHINCYDRGTRNLYGAFYYYDYGNYTETLDKIDKEINNKIKKLKLIKIEKERNELFAIPKK